MRISAQKMAERFTPGVLSALVERRALIALSKIPPCDGHEISSERAADTWLEDRARDLLRGNVHRAYDEQLIRDCAGNWSRLAGRIRASDKRRDFVQSVGVSYPAGRTITEQGAQLRVADPLWFRRQIRASWTRASENAVRAVGGIRRGRAPYASDEAVHHRAERKRRARDFLQSCVAVNELGEQLSLFDVSQASISNPKIRRGEFMVRCRGFEEIAGDLKHVALFVTATAPGEFHAELSRGGANPNFNGEHVRGAQAWLLKMWARARAKLKRLSVLLYGFRIVEPHHDATPHWHLLLFLRPADAETVRAVLRGFWLSECAAEPGATERRITFERIDASRGTATGYVAKYVSKNIDGAGSIAEATDSETGAPIIEGIARVDAWASTHGIRQFQQIGGPPVGLWREARRVRDPADDPDIERACAAADRSDWSGFCRAVGGVLLTRRTSLKLEQVETGQRNRYGELLDARTVGLRYASAVQITRPHQWRIERRAPEKSTSCATRSDANAAGLTNSQNVASAENPALFSRLFSDLGPVAITVRGLPMDDRRASDRAWLQLIQGAPYGAPEAWTSRETSMAGP